MSVAGVTFHCIGSSAGASISYIPPCACTQADRRQAQASLPTYVFVALVLLILLSRNLVGRILELSLDISDYTQTHKSSLSYLGYEEGDSRHSRSMMLCALRHPGSSSS